MKGDFIPKFIKAIIETGKDLHEIWQWQPLYYKGFHVSGYNYKKAEKGIFNLYKRNILRKISRDQYQFTNQGKTWFYNSLSKYCSLKHSKWDKKWRIVIFDIPEELHANRNRFRKILKNIGFYMLQKASLQSLIVAKKNLEKYAEVWILQTMLIS